MPSIIAKKAAGTYIADSVGSLPTVLAWLTQQCRQGVLSSQVNRFCEAQQEMLEPALLIVESIDSECIQCKIPCRCYDHESAGTFAVDIRFALNPQTGECCRS